MPPRIYTNTDVLLNEFNTELEMQFSNFVRGRGEAENGFRINDRTRILLGDQFKEKFETEFKRTQLTPEQMEWIRANKAELCEKVIVDFNLLKPFKTGFGMVQNLKRWEHESTDEGVNAGSRLLSKIGRGIAGLVLNPRDALNTNQVMPDDVYSDFTSSRELLASNSLLAIALLQHRNNGSITPVIAPWVVAGYFIQCAQSMSLGVGIARTLRPRDLYQDGMEGVTFVQAVPPTPAAGVRVVPLASAQLVCNQIAQEEGEIVATASIVQGRSGNSR